MKASTKLLIFAVLLYIALGVTYIFSNGSTAPISRIIENTANISRHAFGLLGISLWYNSIKKRMVNKRVAGYLFSVGIIMAIWYSAKTVKYCFLPSPSTLNRFCWYTYYIGMIFIPLLGFFLTDYIGKNDDYVAHNKKKWLLIPACVLTLITLTNDFHQLVFIFPNGFQEYEKNYEYGIFQYINFVWIIGMSLCFIFITVLKTRTPSKRGEKLIPFVIFLFATAYWLIYAFIRSFADLDTVTTNCFIIITLLEALIRSGQIRSNMNYTRFLAQLSEPVWIVDKSYNVVFKSRFAKEISHRLMKSTEGGDVTLGNSRLRSEKITGGRVLWETDITEFTALIEELKYTEREISDENSLINSEITLKEQKAHFDEQNKLYDRISDEAKPSFEKIGSLCADAEREGCNRKKVLSQIAFIGSYIKRRSNLFILMHDNDSIDSRELELCFRESSDNLALSDVSVYFNSACNGFISTAQAIRSYDICEKLIEYNFNNIHAAMLQLRIENGEIKLRLNLGIDGEFVKGDFEKSEVEFHIDENDVTVNLTLKAGGDVA